MGLCVLPLGMIKWRSSNYNKLKKKWPPGLLCGRWGQPSGVGGEGLAFHRDRCLNGFCRWFYVSSWWAHWQIFPLALLVQSRLERTLCISAGDIHTMTLPIFYQFTLEYISIFI